MTMDSQRRQQLRAKYGMDNPPDPNNPVVGRILAGEQLHRRVFTRDSTELFDPTRSPRMHEIAKAALAEAHAAIAAGRCDNHDVDPFTPLDPTDPALYVHLVGTDSVTVCRGPKHLGAFDRATRGHGPQLPGHEGGRRGVEYYAGMYQLMVEMDAHHDEFCDPDCWEVACNVHLAKNCGGRTQFMPLKRGAVLLVFRVCTPCLDLAGKLADNAYRRNVIDARADLPPGAVIMPNPDPHEHPDAWA